MLDHTPERRARTPPPVRPRRQGGSMTPAATMIALQRTVGNRATARLARTEALGTPTSTAAALSSLADTIGAYRERATAALASSGLAESDAARIRRDLGMCSAGEQRMRDIARSGDAMACAQVLGAFTPGSIQAVLPRLTRVYPVTRVAAGEVSDHRLATMALTAPTATRTASPRRALARLLDGNAVRQAAEAVRPAVPALAAGAAAGGVAIATAPVWVWVVLAVVVVAALAAVAYWAFSDDAAAPQPQPQPQPQPAPAPAPAPPRDRRDDCRRIHPDALTCTEGSDRDEVVQEFLFEQGFGFEALGDCRGMASFAAGSIDACDGAPGERWHCRVSGGNEVSVFGCLCCHEDGSTGFEWRRPHWSINLSKRGGG